MKIIYVEWTDAECIAEWTSIDKIGDVPLLPAVGILVKETKDTLTLAVTTHEGEANAILKIPKAWIKKRKVIKL